MRGTRTCMVGKEGGIPSVLSIAGSDSSGGAGIQADIKTIAAHGLYAQTAITALTSQNTRGVFGIYDVSPEFVKDQIEVVYGDIRPDAVKIGMVGSASIAQAIASSLDFASASSVVLDPVMVSTSGSSLMKDSAAQALVDHLFPLACLITPNLPEAQELSGISIGDEEDMEQAARIISKMMKDDAYVLIKGGHLASSANDLLYGPSGSVWICQERLETKNNHGTGCTLSSAIACGLAVGNDIEQSVRDAKRYLTGALENDPKMGKGNGPLDHMWAYRPR